MENLLMATTFEFDGMSFGIECIEKMRIKIVHSFYDKKCYAFYIKVECFYYDDFYLQGKTGFSLHIDLRDFYFSACLPEKVFMNVLSGYGHCINSEARRLLRNKDFLDFLYRETNEIVETIGEKIARNIGI